jgi:thiamine-monophosphate kinase
MREYNELQNILGKIKRSKKQCNKIFESDNEILKISKNKYITISSDSISEEIDVGLYKDVETWAYLSVISSLSDLCASGATPLGFTLSTQWKYGTSDLVKQQYFSEIKKVCKKFKIDLLGGDSGNSKQHVFNSNILGEKKNLPLSRMKISSGDLIVLHHHNDTGIGPALALNLLFGGDPKNVDEKKFRPRPDWKLMNKLSPIAKAGIDTSDGIATAVYTLAHLNNLGVHLKYNSSINDKESINACTRLGLSELFLWLGDHGDFQTILVIPNHKKKHLPKSKNLTIIGEFTQKKTMLIDFKEKKFEIPLKKVVNVEKNMVNYRQLVSELSLYIETQLGK